MGSSMRESIFADRIVEGLKNWHRMAKRNLDEKRSYSLSSPSTDRGASSRSSEVASLSSNSRKEKAVQLQIPTKREAGRRIIEEKKGSSLSSPSVQPFSFATAGVASSSNTSTSRWDMISGTHRVGRNSLRCRNWWRKLYNVAIATCLIPVTCLPNCGEGMARRRHQGTNSSRIYVHRLDSVSGCIALVRTNITCEATPTLHQSIRDQNWLKKKIFVVVNHNKCSHGNPPP